jgi:hypothetical protein
MNGLDDINIPGMLVLAAFFTIVWIRMVVRDLRAAKKEAGR